eukprot:scaffold212563_cov19-Tisochrysis_lutea.AAC.1
MSCTASSALQRDPCKRRPASQISATPPPWKPQKVCSSCWRAGRAFWGASLLQISLQQQYAPSWVMGLCLNGPHGCPSAGRAGHT